MGFLLTALAAKFLLHEVIPPLRWVGVLLIMLGAGLITWTEKVKEREKQTVSPQPPPSSTN